MLLGSARSRRLAPRHARGHQNVPSVQETAPSRGGFLRGSPLAYATVHRSVAPGFEQPYPNPMAGDGESGVAPPAADAASRFQGGTPSGGHVCDRQTAGATRAQPSRPRKKHHPIGWCFFGAGDEARTRYLDLGKVALYQMSYARKMVPQAGVEPATRGFSVRCSTN